MIPIWGSHIIDYAMWMFGSKPSRVYCEAMSLNHSWEGEDEVTVIMGYPDNSFATIRMSWNTRLTDTAWEGSKMMLSSQDILYKRYIQFESGTLILDDETKLYENGILIMSDNLEMNNFARQLSEFISAIQENRQPIASGIEVRPVIEVQQAALRSALEHKVINLA